MALTEQRVLKQVSLLPEKDAIEVQWADQVLRDGVIIAEELHRRAYTKDSRAMFLAEVENGEAYAAAMGWAVEGSAGG